MILNCEHFGINLTTSLADAHENEGSSAGNIKDMDVHNNKVGIELYRINNGDAMEALSSLRPIVQNGFANNNLIGLKFVKSTPISSNPNSTSLVWVHHYPNED